MPIELKVPTVGESITDVQIGDWVKKVGDRIEKEEVVVVIETDKVTVDLPASAAGVLTEIRVKTGQQAKVGDVIGLIEVGATAAPDAPAPSLAPPADRGSLRPEAYARVMPAAARALADAGLTASQVAASGPGGRLLKEDVERASGAPAAPAVPASAGPASAGAKPATVAAPGSVPAPTGPRHEEVVAMTPMRRRIAERLVQAQQSAALLTTFNECDMSEVMSLRKAHQDAFTKKHGVKLGFMSFFIKAAIEALKEIPQVNAEIRGTDIIYKNYFDIGVAVGGGKGLVVPVIRNAERLSFAEVEKTIAAYAKRAQENKIGLDELQGGTFTISNGGVYGSMLSTPIINPPQSGILGLHAINDRPIAKDGQVVIRPMMYLALTYDHRLVDGREAVTFLRKIKDCIEQPSRILLEL